jgi:hypothetical protein
VKNFFPAVGALSAMAAVGWPMAGLTKEIAPPTKVVGLEAHETHAAASLLGQFRTSISGWLWVRADLYLHNGTEMRPMTDAEKQSGRTAETEKQGEIQDRVAEVTVVPPADRDFRGVLGDIERGVSAYRDMHGHTHNNPVAVLPLFRLMTWMDPQFVPGWTYAAQILGSERSKSGTLKEVDYLRQGLQQNPDNVEILQQLGYAYAVPHPQSDFEHAIPPLVQAVRAGLRSFRELDDDDRGALEESFRWLALCYRETRNQPAMFEVATAGLEKFENDSVLTQLTEPTILTKKGRAQYEASSLKSGSR